MPKKFYTYWNGWKNSSLGEIDKVVANTKFTVGEDYCHFKSVRYKMPTPIIWEFALLFNEETGKVCLISCWVLEGKKSPIHDILSSVKFKM